MVDVQSDSGGLGRNTEMSALLANSSSVATHNPSGEAPASRRCPEPTKDILWRPFTLRPPTLLFFLFSTIGLIVTIEVLSHISTRNGALTFADPQRGFSMAQIFCYRYLPQMVIVLYGIGWAAVDLDVKRLEPYFQLSKPGGASASDSILLRYPFDFMALVPVNAAKRKHWSVFAAGTALVLIFWVITPLQSSLLTIELVTKEIPTQFIPTAKLKSYDSQANELDSAFLYSSYSVTWLGEKIAGFMTREFVAIPFKPINSTFEEVAQGNESWTAVTRVYQTYIDCTPATIFEPGQYDGGAYNFTTDGCHYSLDPIPDKNATRNLMYIGYGNNNGTAMWYLEKSHCTVKSIFLGVWARSRLPSTRSTDIDVAGIFCRPRYFYADADITVDATDLSITRFSFIQEPKPLTPKDKIIDIDIFEQYLAAASTTSFVDTKHFSTVAPATQVRYEDWNLWFPTGQVGYAIGLENKTFDDFGDPKVFGDAMNKTHKLLFNYAVSSLLRDEEQPQQINGTRMVRKEGIIVVPTVAHLLAGFLSAVAVCLASVFFLSYNRHNNLRSDPDTLATTMSLVAQSPQLLRDFEGADNCPGIKRCIKRRQYKLWGGEDSHRLDVVDGSKATSGGSHESSTMPHDGRGTRPWELSAGMGIFITFFSSGLLVLLVVLYWSSQKYSGLPTLSDRRLVVQFIFSFIPTAIATLMEPLWVVVTRYLALYQPWTELYWGHSSSAASLGLKYTNLPPVLIAPRALARGHYILSLASLVVIASNGLAVALGGLFDNGRQPVSTAMAVKFPLSPSIDTQIQTKGIGITGQVNVTGTFAKDGEEHWLIALTNSTGTPLPPWIAPEFYFLPFEWNAAAGNASDLRSANTWGFGANLTCKLLVGGIYRQQSWAGISYSPSFTRLKLALNVTIPMANGNEAQCNNSFIGFSRLSLMTGRFAGEYLYGLGAADRGDKEADEFCNSLLVMGWNRGLVTAEEGNPHLLGSYENTTILCTQHISSAEFNVVVDNSGFVQRFKRLTPLTYDRFSLFNHSTAITSFKAQLSTIIRTNPASGKDSAGVHSDEYPRSFPHYLIEQRSIKPLYNPSTPPPSFGDAQRGFQDFYSWFTPIVFGQNSERIFRSTTKDGGRKPQGPGRIISIQNRVSMDPGMFYIATTLLALSTLASVAIFITRPKRFLPRLPDTLAAEIGFFYASRALEDTAGTAHMSSAIRERHLASLGLRYGYGKFIGRDGKLHSGVERMGPIQDLDEAS